MRPPLRFSQPAWAASAIAFVVILFSGCASVTPTSIETRPVGIIPATQWGSIPANPSHVRRHKVERITLHHGGVSVDPTRTAEDYLRALQSWSRQEKGWSDLPYHYIIDRDGRVFAGRDIKAAGDTNTEYDPAGHALIMVLGNFDKEEPNALQLDAIVRTMSALALIYGLDVNRIAGHRDYSTQTVCPGKHLAVLLDNGWFVDQVRQRMARSGND